MIKKEDKTKMELHKYNIPALYSLFIINCSVIKKLSKEEETKLIQISALNLAKIAIYGPNYYPKYLSDIPVYKKFQTLNAENNQKLEGLEGKTNNEDSSV